MYGECSPGHRVTGLGTTRDSEDHGEHISGSVLSEIALGLLAGLTYALYTYSSSRAMRGPPPAR